MNSTLDMLKGATVKEKKQARAYFNWLLSQYLTRQRKERALAQNRLEASVPEGKVE